MARRTSPTNQDIQPDNQPDDHHVLPSRPTSIDDKSKFDGGTRKGPRASKEEMQHIREQLAQREAELAVINSIQTALASKLDFQGIIDTVGDKLNEIFTDGNVGIGLIDNARNVASIPYVIENGKRLEYFEVSLDQPSVMQHIIKRRRPVLINSQFRERFGKNDTIVFPGRDQRDLKSWLSVPFFKDGEVIGGVSLRSWDRENAFSESDVRFLQTVANSMIVALENARLFEETQRLLKQTEERASELQMINNIGQTLAEGLDLNSTLERVGDRLHTVLQVDNFGITAFDHTQIGLKVSHYIVRNGKRSAVENFSLSKYRLSMRFAARKGGKPWVVNNNAKRYWEKFSATLDDKEIPRSFVMFPLLASGELVGSITIADFEKENAFTHLPLGMLETIASNMGTAIQNARLFEETQRLLKQTEQRAAELQIINNIGQTLTEGLDLNSMIEHVGDTLRDVFQVENIRIAVVDEKTGLLISPYVYHHGKRIAFEPYWQDKSAKYRMLMRVSARTGTRSWVVNTNAEKNWRKFAIEVDELDIPKSFVTVPLWAGREVIGGISIPDYEKENAFTDFSIGMLETIASNMGTAIQNARLFDTTIRLFQEAQESRAAAERANKAKSAFLANMSHELRTPLNAIMGFTRIVKKKSEGLLPEKQIENLDKVLISSEHLLGLINTVLDIAKIEAGRMDVIPAKFSLGVLADQCATLATPLLKPNVTLEKQVDESIGFIFSDQDKIKQIVLNLLSNAAKFTHEGSVLLSVHKVSDEIAGIAVSDSGIGIAEEALPRVFEEFQQADNTTTRQYGGTGLGLTISRNLARLLGGDLTVTSELGKGSTFTLTVPIRYVRKSTPTNIDADTVPFAESQTDDGTPIRENGHNDSIKTILIVEDIDLNINLLTQFLENDYNLLIARDGEQGIHMAQENNPDLILMDVSLPVINGYDATRRIRATIESVPIIGLSAHAMSGDEEKAKEAGCNDYLTKPVNEELLIQKINQYLR